MKTQKTLTQLKADVTVGKNILLTAIQEAKHTDKGWGYLEPMGIPPKLRMIRVVSHVDTTGFYMKPLSDETKSKGSFCAWPKAENLRYFEDSFSILEKTTRGIVYQVRTYKIIS